jgi:hypothetical protein
MIKLKPEKLAKVKKVAKQRAKNVVGLSEAASLRIRMHGLLVGRPPGCPVPMSSCEPFDGILFSRSPFCFFLSFTLFTIKASISLFIRFGNLENFP